MGRKRKNKQAIKPLDSMEISIPDELKKYLDSKELVLLKCFLANYTIQDIAVTTGYNRNYIMERLIDLGRALAMYELVECRIFPSDVPDVSYLKGWNDCKKFVRRMIHDKLDWRKTVEDRDSGEA